MSPRSAARGGMRLPGTSRASLWFYVAAHFFVTGFTRLYTRMSISGREHIPRTGAFVLAPVHRSYVDTPIAGCVTRRRMHFMGKQEMWKNRQLGWIFSALGSFPVDRGNADREAIRRSLAVLELGEGLVLFPEGERKSGPIVQPLHDGAVYIAVKAGVPIVPVGIGGSERVMPRHAKFVYPRKVHIEIGAPIPAPAAPVNPDGSVGRLPRSAVSDHSDKLHAELQRLFDVAMSKVGWDYD